MRKNGAFSAHYTYDADGRRVRSVDGSGVTDYVYSGLNIIDEVSGGAHEKHVYAGGLHIASNSSGLIEYYHQDHLGSTRLKTNSTGGVVYETNYEPYGPGCGESGSEDYRYTGKRVDPTGLYYFGARYYDPVTGRFTTRDTVFGDLDDPQSLNRYSYCRNNPHKYTDPDGRMAQLALAPVLGPAGLLLITGVFVIAYGPYIMTQIGAISSTSFSLPNIRNQLGFIDNVNENPNTITLAEDDGEAYWRDEELDEHYDKHVRQRREWDPEKTTKEDYNKESTDVFNNPLDEDTFEYLRDNGDLVRYNKRRNVFGVQRWDNSLRTFFKPDDGDTYFWGDVAKWDYIGKDH